MAFVAFLLIVLLLIGLHGAIFWIGEYLRSKDKRQ